MKLSKNIYLLLKIVLGLLLLFFVSSRIGFNNIWQSLLTVNLLFIGLYILFKALSFLFNTLNIFILLHPYNHRIALKEMLHFTILSWSLGIFIPGKLGELSLSYFLKQREIPFTTSIAIFILDRLISFIVLFILGFLSIIFLLPPIYGIYYSLFFVLFFICFILLFFVNSLSDLLLKKIVKKYAAPVTILKKTLRDYIYNHPLLLLLNFIVTIIKWIYVAYCISLLFLAFDVIVPFLWIISIQAVITFISLIPITFNGIGLNEPTGIFLYGLLGVPYATTASLMAIALFLTLSIGGLFLLFFWNKKFTNSLFQEK